MRRGVAVLLAALLGMTALSVGAAEGERIVGRPGGPLLTLVEAGKPRAAIVTPADPTPAEARAAAELQTFLDRITGARLPVTVAGQEPPGALIRVGRSAGAPAERPGPFAPETITLRREGDTLLLQGDPGPTALYAVYAFLERLGCRWLAPGPAWEVVPRAQSIRVGTLSVTERASYPLRALHRVAGREEMWEWMARNRLNTQCQSHHTVDRGVAPEMRPYGLQVTIPEHSFFYWVENERAEEHPDWFAWQNGRRLTPKGWHPQVQLCTSNPELVQYVIGRVVDFCERHPEVKLIGLESNDGGGYCECERCRALDPPAERERGQVSTRYMLFWNQVANAVREKYPDRWMVVLAYANHLEPPAVRPAPNIVVGFCNWREWRAPMSAAENAPQRELLEGWRALGVPLWIYEYTERVGWRGKLLPIASIWGEDLRGYYRRQRVLGMQPEAGAACLTDEMRLASYVSARLQWDPEQSVDALIEEFCRHAYGAAAGPMRAYYRLIETRARGYFVPGTVADLSDYLRPISAEAARLMAQARDTARAGGDAAAVARVSAEAALLDRNLEMARGWVPAREDPWTEARVGPNLLSNGGFEEGDREWGFDVREGEFERGIDDAVACSGKRSTRIRVRKSGWARWHRGVQGLDPAATYDFSVCVKTEGCRGGGAVWLIGGAPGEPRYYLFGKAEGEWMRFTLRGLSAPKGNLGIYLTTQHSNDGAILWFDDAWLVRAPEAPRALP